MAKHTVTLEVPKRKISRADHKFQVKADGKVLGTLAVSKGAVVWFPSGTKYGYKMGWAKFHKFMKDEATRFEAR